MRDHGSCCLHCLTANIANENLSDETQTEVLLMLHSHAHRLPSSLSDVSSDVSSDAVLAKSLRRKVTFLVFTQFTFITLHASPTHTCAVSRAGIGWAGFRQIQQFVPILITANRAVHATLKAQNRQEYVSDMSSSLYFHPLSLFLVLPPSAAPSFTLIQWRNFTRQVIKDQSHDARCGCSFNRWQPPSNFSPLPFPLSEKKREEPKQSLANCCVCLSLWKTVSFPTSIIFWDFILFFFPEGEGGLFFFPSFWHWSVLPCIPSPSALCVVAGLRSSVTVNYGTLETDDQQELRNRERMRGRD